MRRIILWFRIDLLPLNFTRVLSNQSSLNSLLRSPLSSSRASNSILTFPFTGFPVILPSPDLHFHHISFLTISLFFLNLLFFVLFYSLLVSSYLYINLAYSL